MSKKNKGSNTGFLGPFDPDNIEPSGHLLALDGAKYMVSYISDSVKSVDEDGDDRYRQDFMTFDSSIKATGYYDSLSNKKGICNLAISVVVDRDQFLDDDDDAPSREEIAKEIKYHKAFQECYYIYRDDKFYSSECREDLVDKVLDAICRAGKKPSR